jgi:hypothetical protein
LNSGDEPVVAPFKCALTLDQLQSCARATSPCSDRVQSDISAPPRRGSLYPSDAPIRSEQAVGRAGELIIVIAEDPLAPVAALGHGMGMTGDDETGDAGHAGDEDGGRQQHVAKWG